MDYFPQFDQFIKAAKRGNVIPVYRKINADLDTPVSTFLKLKKNDYAFLLESVEGQESIARYSFMGTNPSLIVRSKGETIEIIKPFEKTKRSYKSSAGPLAEIKQIMQKFKAVQMPGLPRFYGGLVGYLGYDNVRFFERISDKNPEDVSVYDSVFMLTDTIIIVDHVRHAILIVANVIIDSPTQITQSEYKKLYAAAIKRIDSLYGQLSSVLKLKNVKVKTHQKNTVLSNMTKNNFMKAVQKAKEFIRKGDIIQVVLSQRFSVKIHKDPFEVYRSLRSLNPSPYMYFFKLADTFIVGSSPEMLVRCENGFAQTRPIAGTRRRGKDETEDEKLKRDLLGDEKEKAEHLMLVDLGRNDLGRIAAAGSVKVREFMNVEKYSHVMHLVSSVSATLDNKRYDVYDVLKAAFPAGTVSGSPKIRAMEIIDELEPTRRGVYAGCIGYFSFSHNMDTCIAIRTIVVKNSVAYIQAGAGIVADSVPAQEYQESLNKARALLEAISQ